MKKKVLKITGNWDGNAFAIMGNTQRELRKAGVEQVKIDGVLKDAMSSDYSHLLATCVKALEEAGYEIR